MSDAQFAKMLFFSVLIFQWLQLFCTPRAFQNYD